MEAFEESCRLGVHIREDLFEGTAAFVCDTMLSIGKPPDEVVHTDVIGVFDDMMDDAFVGFAFLG